MILHITGLFPCECEPSQGVAVKQLIDAIPNNFKQSQLIVRLIPLSFFPISMAKSKWKCFAKLRKQKYSLKGSTVFFPIVLLPKGKFRRLAFLRTSSLHRFITSENLNPALIHAHTSFIEGHYARVMSIKMSIPYVLTVRREIDFESNNLVEKEKKEVAVNVKNAALVIAPSLHLKKKCLQNTGIDPLLIPNGIQEENIITVPEFEERIRKRNEDKKLVVTTVASLDKNKRIDIVLKVVSRILKEQKNISLNIVGDGPLRSYLINMTKDLGIYEQVYFHGKIPHSEVIKILHDSDVFFLPSLTETFGLSYLEALAQGVPIIGTKEQGIHGVAQENVHGFFCKREDEYYNALRTLICNHELRVSMGIKGIQLARTLTWTKSGRKLAEAYLDLLKISRHHKTYP